MSKGIAALAPLALGLMSCGGPAEDVPAALPSNLDINSSKRSCSTTAELAMVGSGVPGEAIKQICDCSIDRMIETGDFTANSPPDDTAMEMAMEHCLNVMEAEMLSKDQNPPPSSR